MKRATVRHETETAAILSPSPPSHLNHMNAIDDYYQNDHDFRYDMLVKALGDKHININEADWMDRWLASEAEKCLMQATLAKSTVNLEDFTSLQENASEIAQQFGYLEQFSELGQVFFHAYRSVKKSDAWTISEYNQWLEFREQMTTGLKLMAEAAGQVAKQITESRKRKGRPSNDWRNTLLLDLYNHLESISDLTKNDRALLTHSVFDIYFHDDCPNEPESMKKIVMREQQKKARTELHKSV